MTRKPLREKCPNTELFLVRIFLYSDWIRREYLSIWVSLRIQSEYSKYGPEIAPYLDTFHAVVFLSFFYKFCLTKLEYLSIFSPNTGKYRPEKNSVFGYFSRSEHNRNWMTHCVVWDFQQLQTACHCKTLLEGDSKNNGYFNIYLFKVNNRNSRKRCEICSKLK